MATRRRSGDMSDVNEILAQPPPLWEPAGELEAVDRHSPKSGELQHQALELESKPPF